MKTLFICIFYFLILLNFGCVFGFAQDSSLDKTGINNLPDNNPKETYEQKISTFEALRPDKKIELFPDAEKFFRGEKNEESKLYLARLYLANLPLKKGNRYFLEDAIQIIQSYLNKFPNSSEAYIALGKAYGAKFLDASFNESKGNDAKKFKEKSIECFKTALRLNPENSDANYELADSLEFSDPERLNYLNKAIQKNTKNNEAWNALCFLLSSQKKYDEAEKNYLLWLNTSPASKFVVSIYVGLGDIFQAKGDYESAWTWYEKALILNQSIGDLPNPEDDPAFLIDGSRASILNSIGETALKKGNSYLAETSFLEAVNLNPKNTILRFNLANLYQNTKRIKQAIAEYEQVLAYQKDNWGAVYNLALAYKTDGNSEKAKELWMEYIKQNLEKEDPETKLWVENAKSNLRSLYVYEFPKSKKEITKGRLDFIRNGSIFATILMVLIGITALARKFRRIARAVIVFFIASGITIISVAESSSSEPKLAHAILAFIPVLVIGGFFLYLLREKKK